jgi:hypothetical protein
VEIQRQIETDLSGLPADKYASWFVNEEILQASTIGTATSLPNGGPISSIIHTNAESYAFILGFTTVKKVTYIYVYVITPMAQRV